MERRPGEEMDITYILDRQTFKTIVGFYPDTDSSRWKLPNDTRIIKGRLEYIGHAPDKPEEWNEWGVILGFDHIEGNWQGGILTLPMKKMNQIDAQCGGLVVLKHGAPIAYLSMSILIGWALL